MSAGNIYYNDSKAGFRTDFIGKCLQTKEYKDSAKLADQLIENKKKKADSLFCLFYLINQYLF